MIFTQTDVITDGDLAVDDVNDDPTKSISVTTLHPPPTANALQSSDELTDMQKGINAVYEIIRRCANGIEPLKKK